MEVLKEEVKNSNRVLQHTQRQRLRRNQAGFLVCLDEAGRERQVNIRPCFPWAEPMRFFSLRDRENQEVHFVRDLSDLDSVSRKAFVEALEESGFCFVIERVLVIKEDFELRHWEVITRQGARCFQTGLTSWPRRLDNGGLLIQDVAGDICLVPDPAALSEKDRRALSAFLD